MNSTKTFAHQDTLPRLPIPSLQDTADRLLATLRPFDEKEVAKTEQLLKDFIKLGGLGETLQHRLKEHDKTQENSWLEKWWLEYAYHRFRETTLVNVNWYCLAKDDPSAPKNNISDNLAPFSQFQIKRAAHLISGFLDFWQKIEREELPVEFAGKEPICMNQYKCMFGVTRIPKKDCDYLNNQFPCNAKHITVLAKNHLYKLPVFDKSGQNILSTAGIHKLLIDIVQDAKKSPPSDNICLLTAGHRDNWSEAREILMKVSQNNKNIFAEVQDSLFFVSLDDYATRDDVSSKQKNIFVGQDANNRWLDAAMSIVIDATGTAGLNGEHSPLDALVPALVLDYSVKLPLENTNDSTKEDILSFQKYQFEGSEKVSNFVENAKKTISETIKNSDSDVLVYSGYGQNFIKKIAKTSPDAYIQMAIQLAYYNIYGKCVSTYESGSARKYKHGRTEVIRTLSSDSLAFCQAMKDESATPEKRYMLLQNAAKAHVKYAIDASQGKGVDRHLLGLKLCLKPGESHELFSDKVYNQSQSWTLSTSAMFKTDHIWASGFGAVDPSGYGMNYIPSLDGNRITFGVESKVSCNETSTAKFIASLEWALDELKIVCENTTTQAAFQKSPL